MSIQTILSATIDRHAQYFDTIKILSYIIKYLNRTVEELIFVDKDMRRAEGEAMEMSKRLFEKHLNLGWKGQVG